ncbi:MAG: carbamoyl-phosphate synthase large subunit [Spirochaetes bacterium]|nr:carbamoyl-phosphate synthase large subunit [Spirochaetota bacterium]MBN2769316.1 carbamoyl-phosphate synthase large subunit [Spirochaetota bacterium]
MPKRDDIHKILIIGSGPIVIGQACEFDYSGSQACKALKEEGYQVVLVNSNPATIMTDPEMADSTYIEPITPEFVKRIIEIEKPDALLPTVGGQTALNTAMSLYKMGVLDENKVQLIGANVEAIEKAEDRDLFKKAMIKIGADVPKSMIASNLEEAMAVLEEIKLPLIIRSAFTLGGSGGNIVYNKEDYVDLVMNGIDESPINQVIVEESVLGWKEFELEVMRDTADNVVIVCSIENIDPMGVHTGDSITVAPQQTLTDREYQNLRDLSLKIIREIGVDTGGSNIQFAVNPENGRVIVIEMNPRVSRSSALASKATGFPIAKIAAKLAVGYTLDEIRNDITRETPASFEPSIDYVVLKVPRFNFEKFPGADNRLGPQMKAVGEAMAIGRTFKESLQKAMRSLEDDRYGLGSDGNIKIDSYLRSLASGKLEDVLEYNLMNPFTGRIFYVKLALEFGWSVEKVYNLSGIDPWFLYQIKELVDKEKFFKEQTEVNGLSVENLKGMKESGYSDRQIAYLLNADLLNTLYSCGTEKQKEYAESMNRFEDDVRSFRMENSIIPGYRLVDTCAGEFEAYTPYYYSSYDSDDESIKSGKKSVMILGGGPNRIGQGIEFDYCCCHASYALEEEGYESIMVNSNPETVSTDYDTSDKLYFEPLTLEDILHIYNKEKPEGVIVQFGGQTPLKLARRLLQNGVNVLGTSPDSIDRAEDRERFSEVVNKLNLKQPENGMAFTREEAFAIADRIGYPVLVRPSYVLGGRAMAIIYNRDSLADYIENAVDLSPEHPVLVDDFLEEAVEVDVDAICDGDEVYVAAIMRHVELAGVHSGDSACVIPPVGIAPEMVKLIEKQTEALAFELGVMGLLNIQFAVKGDDLYILEVNPRASRTVPFVSKAKGIPVAKIALKVMTGRKLKDFNLHGRKEIDYVCVKEAVLPFKKFPGVDTVLTPEMKSTGEVMGVADNFNEAYYKASLAAGDHFPLNGTVFVSLNKESRDDLVDGIRLLAKAGYKVAATSGTADYLKTAGIGCDKVFKVKEGRPDILDLVKNGDIHVIFNTPAGYRSKHDSNSIRQVAVRYKIPIVTTVPGIKAAVDGMLHMKNNDVVNVKPIQQYHAE